MYDLVVIGNVSIDENIIRGEKYLINSGAAYLTALAGSLCSKKIGLVTRIGGDYSLENLKRLGVDLKGVKQISPGRTARFFHTYLNDEGSERTFREDLGVAEGLNTQDIPKEYLNSKYVHIATNHPRRQQEFIEYIRERSKALLSIDTIEQYIQQFPEETKKAFTSVDIVFIDQREKDLMKYCRDKNMIMIIKRGKLGAEYHENKLTIKAPTRERKVIDKTGAGDVLAGTFLVLLAMGSSKQEALERAVKVASDSVEEIGIDFLLNKRNENNNT